MESSSSETIAFDIDPKAPGSDLTGKTIGDFQILKLLGQGGMGEVYLAEQVSLKRKVALKTMRSEVASKPTALKRFQKEAEAVAKFTHPNIVQIYFLGEADGLRYIVLEYVDGVNLAAYIGKKGPVPLPLAFSIMKQAASALHHAGEHGIVHRDIKPENILLNRKGEVKITDFGLARTVDEEGQPMNLTQTGMIVGTPHYMSPEQVQGKKTDHRTDIYSFGATCYYMLSGKPPYQGTSIFELAKQHVEGSPKLLNVVRPDVPAELVAVINKMMAKKVDERYQSGQEIVRDLQKLQQRLRDLKLGSGSNITPALSLTAMDHSKTEAIPLMRDPKQESRSDEDFSNNTETIPEPELNETPPAMPRPKKKKGKTKKQPQKANMAPLLWIAATAIILLPMLGVGAYVAWMAGGFGSSKDTRAGTQPGDPSQPGKTRQQFLEEEVFKEVETKAEIDQRDELRAELGALYVEQYELDKAEQFFQRIFDTTTTEIGKAPMHQSSLVLAQIGMGITLCFKKRYNDSTNMFQLVAVDLNMFPRGAAYKWLNNPRLRPRVKECLDKNAGAADSVGIMIPPQVEGIRRQLDMPSGGPRLPGLPPMPGPLPIDGQ